MKWPIPELGCPLRAELMVILPPTVYLSVTKVHGEVPVGRRGSFHITHFTLPRCLRSG